MGVVVAAVVVMVVVAAGLGCCLTTSTTTTTPGINTITCNSSVAPSLISSPDGVTPGNGASSESVVTSDGNFFVFTSSATNLAEGVASTVPQIYMLDSCLEPTSTTVTTCTRSMILISSSGCR